MVFRVRSSLSSFCPITALTMLIFLTVGRAEDPPADKPGSYPTNRTRSFGDVKPKPLAQADWPVPGFNRKVLIHQADTTDLTFNRVFFAAPVLALAERTDPLPGYTAVVQSAKPRNGLTTLKFQAVLFLEELRPVAAAQVAIQWPQGLRQLKIRPEEVEVRSWPITHCVVDCVVGGKVLATGQTGSLVDVSETIHFALDFSADALAEFKEAARDGEVEFVFAYTYENREVAIGEVTTRATKTASRVVNDVLRNTLNPAQRDGSQPILMKQVQDIAQTCRLSVMRTVRLQHKELLPLLNEQTSLTDKFFAKQDPVKWDDLDKNDKLREDAAKVLMPLVQSWAKSDQDTLKDEAEKEHRAEVTTKVNGGFSFKLPVLDTGINGGADKTTTDIRRDLLKNEHGVITTKTKDGKYYVPSDVQVFRWVGGKDDVDVSESNVVYLAVGKSDHYFEGSSVPITYTAGKLRRLLASAPVKPIEFGPTLEEKLVAATWSLKQAQAFLARSKVKVADIQQQLKQAEAEKRDRENDSLPKKQARETAQAKLASANASLQEVTRKKAGPVDFVTLLNLLESERRYKALIDEIQPQVNHAQEAEALANRQLDETTAKIRSLQTQLREAQNALEGMEKNVDQATEVVEKLRAAGH
jgi:hypothetical protein